MRWLLILPLYIALSSIFGYAVSFLSIPLTRSAYIIFNLGFVVFAWWWSKRYPLPKVWVWLPSFIAWLMLYLGFHTYITPPNNHDVPNHYFMISQIREKQTLKYARIFEGYETNSWYMLGFHNLIVNWLDTFNLNNLNEAVFPLVWGLVALYPLAIYFFTEAVTGKSAISLTAAFLSLTMMMFPTNVLGWGGWSFSLGIVLVYFSLGQLIYTLRSPRLIEVIRLLTLMAGLFLVHTTELLWFLIMALPFIWRERQQMRRLIVNRRVLIAIVAAGICIAPLMVEGGQRMHSAINPRAFEHYPAGATLFTWWVMQVSSNGNILMTLAFLLGLRHLIKNRQSPMVGLTTLGLLTIWWLRNTTPLFDPVNQRLFPLMEPDRIYALAAGFISIMAAMTLVRLSHGHPRQLALMIIGCCAWPLWMNTRILQRYLDIDTTVTVSDIGLMKRHEQECRLYLNDDYADAGRWIPYFSTSKVVLPGPSELLPDIQARTKLLTSTNWCEAKKNNGV